MWSWNLVSFWVLLVVSASRTENAIMFNTQTSFINLLSEISKINATETTVRAGDTGASSLSEECSKHYQFYQQSLMNFETWAMYMFDSSTKFPEGVAYGTFTHLGNYDECIKIQDVTHTDGSIFHGKHCLATISVDMPTRSGAVAAAVPLRIAVCLPSSCNMTDVGILGAQNFKTMLNAVLPGVGSSVQVGGAGDDMYCHTFEKPDFKTSDWIAVAIYSVFGVLVILSTAYDVLTRNSERRSNLLLAFSAYTNVKKLLATSSGTDNLSCVHGIRFLSIAWVVLGHRYMNALTAPYTNIMEFMQEFYPEFRYLYITNSQLAVDSFFVLSGLLVAYVFFRTVSKTNSFNVLLYYIHRYIRLTPALAAMVLFEGTLLTYAGAGPLWESTIKHTRENCENNWWSSLIYIQNFYESNHQCVGQAWYLSVDMQLYWLSPLVLIPLWKFPKVGWILSAGLAIGGIVTNFLISYIEEFSGSDLTGNIKNPGDYNKYFYFPTYCRFVPYLVGIGLGYILVSLKNKNGRVKHSKVVTCILWLIAAFLMTLTLCIVHIFQQNDYEYEPVGPAFYNSLGKPGWAVGLALFIYLCVTGHGGFVNDVLSWKGFQPLGRLSFGIYLVHMDIQTSLNGSTRTLWYLSDTTLIPAFASDLVISIFFAAILSVVFESPFVILEKELLGGKKKPSAPLAVVNVPRSAVEEKHQTVGQSENVERSGEEVQVRLGSNRPLNYNP